MIATFTLENADDYDVEDIVVRCIYSAPSGTSINRNERTIYEVVNARSTRTFTNFNMGFLHSQVDRSNCSVKHLSLATSVRHSPKAPEHPALPLPLNNF